VIRWRKVKAVASFEFLSTVKRKGYLIATFGMPIFMLAYVAVIGFFSGYAVAKKEKEIKLYGVVDHAQVLRLEGDAAAPLPPLPKEMQNFLAAAGQPAEVSRAMGRGNAIFRPFADENEARAALQAQKVRGYYVVADDYLRSGRVDSVVREGSPLDSHGAGDQLGELLVQRMLAGKVSDDVASLVKQPIKTGKNLTYTNEGQLVEKSVSQEVAKIVVPIIFMILLMASLLASAGYLLQAVATEKENKVVEVLLSSADPDEILAGKLLGLGGAGLIQIAVWFSMAAAGGTATVMVMSIAGVQIPWLAISLGVAYFVLGYLLVGSLMIGTASLGSTIRESQQLSMVWSILTVVPMIALNSLLAEPNGVVARVLTWIPFTSPLTMVMRLSMDPHGVAWWEIVGSLAMLVVGIYAAINIGARLFRVGVLLSGARPKLREILRQAGLAPRRA